MIWVLMAGAKRKQKVCPSDDGADDSAIESFLVRIVNPHNNNITIADEQALVCTPLNTQLISARKVPELCVSSPTC